MTLNAYRMRYCTVIQQCILLWPCSKLYFESLELAAEVQIYDLIDKNERFHQQSASLRQAFGQGSRGRIELS